MRRHLVAVDVVTGEPLSHQVFELNGPDEPPLQARALGRDRLYLAFEDAHGEVRSMDCEVLAQRDAVVGGGEFLGIAPGGGLLAGADIASGITVLDDQLAPVARLTGFSSTAVWLGFVSDDLLVTRHFDGATLLWQLSTSQLVGRLFESAGFEPYGLVAADDGPAVLHATAAGVIRIPIDPDGWRDAVCGLVSRPLLQEELDAIAPGRELLHPCGFGPSPAAAGS